jgi:hypothetical protein
MNFIQFINLQDVQLVLVSSDGLAEVIQLPTSSVQNSDKRL